MFAVYAAEPNADAPLDSLTVGERPAPEVPDGWVAVNVTAASLNMHDIWTLRGVGIKPDQFPMILGCDGAGRLEDGTEVVLHSLVGDPNWFGDETLDPKRNMLTEKAQGSFAETVVVPRRNAIPRPAGVTARSDEKRALAERLGAHATFASGERLPGRVDGVFETVGEATWAHSMRSLKPGGVIVVSGSTSGPNPGADLQRLFSLQLRVTGSTMGTRQELVDLLRFVENAGISPEIGLELPMDRAAEGFRAMLDGDTSGKIVFTR